MYDSNGPKLSPQQTPTLESSNSNDSGELMKLALFRLSGRALLLLMLGLLALLLTACATTSAPSDFTPRNPAMPQPSQSQPSQTYSSSAAALIQSWRKSLTDTLATQ